MKYLLLLAILVIAYVLWRNARIRDARTPHSHAPGRPGQPQDMVCCPVCSVHLPRADAVKGAGGLLYCSQEHRLRAGA
jgi:uncharacterized protein